LFCLSTMSMDMSHNKSMAASMSPCPYMVGGSSMCTMNLFDHIQSWQDALRAIPTNTILLVALLLLATFTFSFIRQRYLQEQFERIRIRLYERLARSHTMSLYTHLFSQGILNTKSY
jgi:hypothetical protein